MSKKTTQKKFPRAYSEDGGTRFLTEERFRIYAPTPTGAMFRRCLGSGPNIKAAWAKAALADKI